MAEHSFHGRTDLISRLDSAVCLHRVEDVVESVKVGLVDLLSSGDLRLPPELTRPSLDGYARRLLYKSPTHGYAVIAMTWGPLQGTPLHDHSGVWCVEGVVAGQIDVTQYAFRQKQGSRWRFESQGTVRAAFGSAGWLIPPFEYHTIQNALDADPSVTLHVYGRELEQCTVFEGPLDGWYEEKTKPLGYVN